MIKDKIICESIESIRKEGLKFSVDILANKLGVSKKTIYKFFPNKEALALAIYEKYYSEAKKKAEMLIGSNDPPVHSELLHLYFDSKTMTRRDIFNKFKLNDTIYSYTAEQNDILWQIISLSFKDRPSEQNMKTTQIIVDGAFEKLCNSHLNPDDVIERLAQLLWL